MVEPTTETQSATGDPQAGQNRRLFHARKVILLTFRYSLRELTIYITTKVRQLRGNSNISWRARFKYSPSADRQQCETTDIAIRVYRYDNNNKGGDIVPILLTLVFK